MIITGMILGIIIRVQKQREQDRIQMTILISQYMQLYLALLSKTLLCNIQLGLL